MKTVTLEALEDYQHCPRRRYWLHEYKGRGLKFRQYKLNDRLEELVSNGLIGLFMGEGMEADKVRLQFLEDGRAPGFRYPRSASNKFYDTVSQYAHLAEGLIRGYAAYKMSRFLSRWDVYKFRYSEGKLSDSVNIKVPIDMLVTEKSTGDIYAVRFVVTSRELPTAAYYHTGLALSAAAKIAGYPVRGVLFEIIFRGELREGDLFSPLVRGYYNYGCNQYSWQKKVLMLYGEEKYLGKDWKPFTVPQHISSQDWIDVLCGFSKGQGPFREIFPDWNPICFSEPDVDEFIDDVRFIENIADKPQREYTKSLWNKNQAYCGYCDIPFICWGTEQERLDPLGQHPTELVLR